MLDSLAPYSVMADCIEQKWLHHYLSFHVHLLQCDNDIPSSKSGVSVPSPSIWAHLSTLLLMKKMKQK